MPSAETERLYARLVREGRRSAKWRGHTLKPTIRASFNERVTGFAQCRVCGAYLMVHTHPAPNSIDIHGDSLAIGCRPKEEQKGDR